MFSFNIENLLTSKSLPPIKSWMSLEDVIEKLGTPDTLKKKSRVTELRYGNYIFIFENRSKDLLEINNINPDPLNEPEKLIKLLFYRNNHFEVIIEDEMMRWSHVPNFEQIRYLLKKYDIIFETQKVYANHIHETLILRHPNGLLLEFINLKYNYTDPYPNGKPYYKKVLVNSEDEYLLTAIRF